LTAALLDLGKPSRPDPLTANAQIRAANATLIERHLAS
jgi:hypothetical protein